MGEERERKEKGKEREGTPAVRAVLAKIERKRC